MLRLVAKDVFIYQRRNFVAFLFLAIYLLVMLTFSANSFPFSFLASLISVYGAIIVCQTAFAYDDSYKANKFIRALPISPMQIVLARYISAFVTAVIAFVISILAGLLFNLIAPLTGHGPVDLSFDLGSVLIWFSLVSVACAFLVPALYKFGYVKARYPLMILIIALFALMPTAMQSPAVGKIINTVRGNSFIMLALSAALLTGSIFLSRRVLIRQEQ